MGAHDLESKLGKSQKAYTSGKGRIVVNVILTLIWFLLGYGLVDLLWGFYKAQVAAVVVGLVILASGVAFVIISYRRVGRQVHLYEKGVQITTRGKTQSWRFDEIDGVSVISGRNAQAVEGLFQGFGLVGAAVQAAVPIDALVGADINGYRFFVGGTRAFDIDPGYKHWKEVGAAVFVGVMERLVPRLVDCLGQGEQVVFDRLTAEKLGRTRLVLTQSGIQEKDKSPVPWTEVVGVSEGKERGFATVVTLDREKSITFGVDSALNAFVARQVIRTMIKNTRASQGNPPTRSMKSSSG